MVKGSNILQQRINKLLAPTSLVLLILQHCTIGEWADELRVKYWIKPFPDIKEAICQKTLQSFFGGICHSDGRR